jgi:uncharacterized membrane protein
MAFCNKCGTQLEDDAKFCPSCGETTGKADFKVEDVVANIKALNNTADTTAEFDANDIASNKVMAVLSYFGILWLIPLFAAKESKFARYHANQGIILFICNMAYSIASTIIDSIFTAISYRLGFVGTILDLVSIVFLVLAIIGIINAANGKAKELPVIGKYKILK